MPCIYGGFKINIWIFVVPPGGKMIRLKKQFFKIFKDHAQELYPYECCGVLVGKLEGEGKIVSEVCQTTNVVAGERKDWFNIEPKELMKIFQRVAEEEKEVLGFYHSHPNGSPNPSQSDLEHVSWSFYSYVIVSLDNMGKAEIKSWLFNEDKGEFEEEGLVWE
jgi:proteasome lid subunit RPN8/RPN11